MSSSVIIEPCSSRDNGRGAYIPMMPLLTTDSAPITYDASMTAAAPHTGNVGAILRTALRNF